MFEVNRTEIRIFVHIVRDVNESIGSLQTKKKVCIESWTSSMWNGWAREQSLNGTTNGAIIDQKTVAKFKGTEEFASKWKMRLKHSNSSVAKVGLKQHNEWLHRYILPHSLCHRSPSPQIVSKVFAFIQWHRMTNNAFFVMHHLCVKHNCMNIYVYSALCRKRRKFKYIEQRNVDSRICAVHWFHEHTQFTASTVFK